jgi:hypothetical protein
MLLKIGTRIEIRGFDLSNKERWEAAKIGRQRKSDGAVRAGYHPITYLADGAQLLCHESGFRVISNAPGECK